VRSSGSAARMGVSGKLKLKSVRIV
jgi:hypothetical protein